MADNSITLLSAVEATGAGTAVAIDVPAGKENVPVQIAGITTATVDIEGSLDDGTTWDVIVSKTADFAGVVPAFPKMRANVSAWTSGAISVYLYADRKFGG